MLVGEGQRLRRIGAERATRLLEQRELIAAARSRSPPRREGGEVGTRLTGMNRAARSARLRAPEANRSRLSWGRRTRRSFAIGAPTEGAAGDGSTGMTSWGKRSRGLSTCGAPAAALTIRDGPADDQRKRRQQPTGGVVSTSKTGPSRCSSPRIHTSSGSSPRSARMPSSRRRRRRHDMPRSSLSIMSGSSARALDGSRPRRACGRRRISNTRCGEDSRGHQRPPASAAPR